MELSARYARTAEGRARNLLCPQMVIRGDAREIGRAEFWKKRREELEEAGIGFSRGLPQFDFAITSPPYWQMLKTSRGGVLSKHKQRAARGLDTAYSRRRDDLGNIAEYGRFVDEVGGVFDKVKRCVKEGKYLVVVAQNLRAPDGKIKPLAWGLARRIEGASALKYRSNEGRGGRGKLLPNGGGSNKRGQARWVLQGERIWCQNTKPLGIWGYPKIFVPNYHHHYCLIFRKSR